jgi:hypothetical protein
VRRRARPCLRPFLVAICLFSGFAAAASPTTRRVAVLEFKGRAVKDEVRLTLSDAVRTGVLEAVRGRALLVMTRENMAALVKEMGRTDCSEGDCEVETARNIGADYVVSGDIAFIEGTYVAVLKLHQSEDGRLLGTATAQAQNQLGLIEPLRERGRDLVRSSIGVSASPQQSQPPQNAQQSQRTQLPQNAQPPQHAQQPLTSSEVTTPPVDETRVRPKVSPAVPPANMGDLPIPQDAPPPTLRVVRIGQQTPGSQVTHDNGRPVGVPILPPGSIDAALDVKPSKSSASRARVPRRASGGGGFVKADAEDKENTIPSAEVLRLYQQLSEPPPGGWGQSPSSAGDGSARKNRDRR